MILLQSTLENVEDGFCNIKQYFNSYNFTLGGNWDYHKGYMDRPLDAENKVWIRVPFQVTQGMLDGVSDNCDAVVKLGRPFVLTHLYNEGVDHDAQPRVAAALIDQFQDPVDKDAEVNQKWVTQAEQVIREVELGLLH